MSAPLIFLDSETTGLTYDDEIWDLALIRRDTSGVETAVQTFVAHDVRKSQRLPHAFLQDYRQRYDPTLAIGWEKLIAEVLDDMFRPDDKTGKKAHIVGNVPNFDTERIAKLYRAYGLDTVPWHHHLIDVENLAVGYLLGYASTGMPTVTPPTPPWDSEKLSRMVGVDPNQFDRHTALGDALWAKAAYDTVTGYRSTQGIPEGGEQNA